jgi:hypothetical protein
LTTFQLVLHTHVSSGAGMTDAYEAPVPGELTEYLPN